MKIRELETINAERRKQRGNESAYYRLDTNDEREKIGNQKGNEG